MTAPASNLSAGTGVGVGSGGGNTVVELIYQNIRKTSIPVGFPFPSKFEELYPQDAKLLSSRELSDLNTKILFDILIRKTVAAKWAID